LYTDSKAALKEAVMRPSQRLSPTEVIEESEGGAKKRRCGGRGITRKGNAPSRGLGRCAWDPL